MSLERRPRRGPLAWTLALAAVTGLSAMGLVQHLARTIEKRPRLAAAIAEPEVTGSIAASPTRPVPAGMRSVPLGFGAQREWLLVRGPPGAPGIAPGESGPALIDKR